MSARKPRFQPEEVEDFLATPGGLLGELASPGGAVEPEDPRIGRSAGAFRITALLGRGGMSSVYRGEREDGAFQQSVAIKFLECAPSPGLLARFHRERNILAELRHPSIAYILDGGQLDEAQPYLVMELVEGVRIDAYCDEHGLTIPQRLALFLQAARGVQHAHSHLVVHRDVKPDNILVDRDGRVKLLDFGIAKVLGTERSEPAVTREYLMTPLYATPEQVHNQPVTLATDVYQLGLLLYRLLSGRDAQTVESLADVVRVVCETPAASLARQAAEPGADTQEIAAARGTTPARLARTLSGELDWIVRRCLRKRPEERYPTVDAVIEDVEAYLARRPVRARPPSAVYLLSCFVRRHRFAAYAAALALAAVLAGSTVALVGMVQARRAEAAALREARSSDEVLQYLVGLFESNDPRVLNRSEVRARDLLDEGARRIAGELHDQPERRATLLHAMGTAYFALGVYPQAQALLEEAVALRAERLEPEHVRTVESREALGQILLESQQWAAAELELESVARLRRKALGADDPITLNVELLHADSLQGAGRWREAEALYEPLLERARRVLPDDSDQLAIHLLNLASCRVQLGELDGVGELYEQCIARRERTLGPTHFRTSEACVSAAAYYQLVGNGQRVVELLQKALRWREDFPGPHPHTQVCLANLGSALAQRERPRDALPYLEEALAMARDLYDDASLLVAETRDRLGATLLGMHLLPEARTELELAGHAYGDAGGDSGRRAQNLTNLAILEEVEGNPRRALGLYGEAADMTLRLRGPGHGLSLSVLGNLGRLLLEEEEYRAALEPLELAYEAFDEAQGLPFPRANLCRHACRVFALHGDFARAVEAGRRQVALEREQPSGDPLQLGAGLTELGRALRASGRLDAARDVLTEALGEYRTVLGILGRDSGAAAAAEHEVALVAHRCGDLETARVLMEEAWDGLKWNPSLPAVQEKSVDLARLLVDLGELDAAEVRLREALPLLRGAEQPLRAGGIAWTVLSDCLAARQDFAGALEAATNARCLLSSCMPPGNTELADATSALGLALAGVGRTAEGEHRLEEALETLRETAGPASDFTRRAARRLVQYYTAAGEEGKAAEVRFLTR